MRRSSIRIRPGRSVNDRLHHIKTFATAALAVLIAAALEDTVFAKMPFGFRGSPALLLLVVATLGYFFGEQAGALCGLFAGVMADITTGGMMLSPMIFMLYGYACGVGSKRFLAHNLPSFLIFCMVGILWEGLCESMWMTIDSRSLLPFAYLTQDKLPSALLTLAVSPAFYGLARGYMARQEKKKR